jgi:hypothetical protein
VASFVPTQHPPQRTSTRGTPVVGARFPPLPPSRLFTHGNEDFHCGIRNETLTTCSGKSRLIRRSPSSPGNVPESAAYSMLRGSIVKTGFSRLGDL